MVDRYPQPYTTTSPTLVNFDSVDFADGSGMVNFQGANTKQGATKTYILTRETIFANDISTVSAAVETTDAKRLDLDFDLSEFNMPKDIKGTALVTATVKGIKNSGIMNYYYIAKIRKWDGSTETEIASAQSETNSSNSTTDYDTMTVKIPITTLTHFAQGDVLRVTMEVWAAIPSPPGGSGTVTLFHDPMNRTEGTAETTQLKIDIPFRIDQ